MGNSDKSNRNYRRASEKILPYFSSKQVKSKHKMIWDKLIIAFSNPQTFVPATMALYKGWAAHEITPSDKGINLFWLFWLFTLEFSCISSLERTVLKLLKKVLNFCNTFNNKFQHMNYEHVAVYMPSQLCGQFKLCIEWISRNMCAF